MSYICPISHEPVIDPVMAADGHTYERAHIERWLEDHDTSPITNLPLDHKTLVPNYALRGMVKAKAPRRVCVVLDTSGSMDDQCELGGTVTQFRLFDLVRKLVAITYRMLWKQCKVVVIAFSTKVTTITTGDMHPDQLEGHLHTLKADGITRSELALTEALSYRCPVFFLTDGKETDAEGYVIGEPLARRISFTQKVYTLALGYDTNVNELRSIAESTQASFGFISDATKLQDTIMYMVTNELHPPQPCADLPLKGAVDYVASWLSNVLQTPVSHDATQLNDLEKIRAFLATSQHTRIKQLLADLDEVKLALYGENFWRWGYAFLVQFLHGLKTFRRINNKQTQYFPIHTLALTPVHTSEYKPSEAQKRRIQQQCASRGQVFDDTITESQDAFDYDGCYSDGYVDLRNNVKKLVSELNAGDEIRVCYSSGKITFSTVTHIFVSPKNKQNMVKLGNVWVSAYHPVLLQNEVLYPKDISSTTYRCDTLYNIVTTRGHFVFVNNNPFALLGHGVDEGKLAHPYLSVKIRNDLPEEHGKYYCTWTRGKLLERLVVGEKIE